MSNLLKHAERELELIGYDSSTSDAYTLSCKKAVMDLLTTFSKQGHSGVSADIVLELFSQLSRFRVLTPLTGFDSEWSDVSDRSGFPHYQNKRDSRVFKTNNGCYFIDGVMWVSPDGESCSNYNSKVEVTFPLTPKTFYVNVDMNGKVLDQKQIDEVKQYYPLFTYII